MGLTAGIGGGVVSVSYGQETIHRVSKEAYSYQQVNTSWKDCGLRKVEEDVFVSRRMDVPGKATKTATIEVNYGNGFSTEAQEAFQRAVDVWESYIRSDVTIRIDASFEDLGDDVLGGAGPNFFYAVDLSGDGNFDAFVGDALVDAATGEDQQSGEPDIVARFSSTRDDWHFGEEDAPSGTIDFTSVVLHEIGHGLHYIGATSVDSDGTGRYGDVDFDQDGEPDGIPSMFTRPLAREESDGSLTPLLDESTFPNPSTALGDALTGNQLVFDGERANLAADQSTGPVPPKIYAPSDYNEGSSIFHLDEDTYPPEEPNTLMTPRISTAETNRLPGPIMCGQLFDMGWPAGGECEQFFQVLFVQVADEPEPNDDEVTLSWQLQEDLNVDEYLIERRYFDGPFTVQRRVDASGASTVSVDGLPTGRHTFRISAIQNGNTVASNTTSAVLKQDDLNVSVYPNPFDEQVNVSITLPADQTQADQIEVQIFDSLGRQVASVTEAQSITESGSITLDARQLGSLGDGVYFVRVRGPNFVETKQAVRVR